MLRLLREGVTDKVSEEPEDPASYGSRLSQQLALNPPRSPARPRSGRPVGVTAEALKAPPTEEELAEEERIQRLTKLFGIDARRSLTSVLAEVDAGDPNWRPANNDEPARPPTASSQGQAGAT